MWAEFDHDILICGCVVGIYCAVTVLATMRAGDLGVASHKKISRLNSSVLTGYLYGNQHQNHAKTRFRVDLRQFELLQHTRVQDTEDTDGVVLAAEVELDSR